MSGDILLEIAGLHAGYGAVPVLFGIDMRVRESEIVCLVGSNGAGKTTLLRAISRIIPARGTLRFGDEDLLPLLLFESVGHIGLDKSGCHRINIDTHTSDLASQRA